MWRTEFVSHELPSYTSDQAWATHLHVFGAAEAALRV
jgi:hypothetical protein